MRGSEKKATLVNEYSQSYDVDGLILSVWNHCDGITLDQVTEAIAKETSGKTATVKGLVTNLIYQLMEAGLVE